MEKWKTSEILITIIAITSLVSGGPLEVQSNLRLPKNIKPIHYELNLETMVHDQGNSDYGGDVKIDILVVESTNQIVLHHRGLNIMRVTLEDVRTRNIITSTWDYNNETEFLIIYSSSLLNAESSLNLEIEFSGKLQTGTAGFYRSQYTLPGETQIRYLAATQFEPTRARSAFPCFDEPEWRSTFKLSIRHGSNYHAISNMVGSETNNGDGTITTNFPTTTVTMPTYLLAFVVSDLTYESFNASNPLLQRIYATKNLIDSGLAITSLYYSEQYLRLLEEFVNNFKYQLPKLYSVAVPDHGSAMENYGLILYKEQYLILENDPHPNEVYDVVGTISHELTHQFFGNVKTCKWWDQIWLNEGFATWGEFLLPELLPTSHDMQFHHLFNIKKTQNALRYDSRQSTRPMTFPTSTVSEISARFDTIAYDKSGAVIRMFQYVTGDDKFKAALYRYLSDNLHESITSDDLLNAFEYVVGNSLGFNFKSAFRTWENNKGYPVINVYHDASTRQFKITQKRYVGGSEEVDANDEYLRWFIPLSYTTGVNSNFDDGSFKEFFLPEENEKVISTSDIAGFDDSQWYIFNIQQHGYYRVNYDEKNWRNIINILNSKDYKKIHVLNRAQLVDDALTMAFDGYLSYEIALDVVKYLLRETEYFPWYSAAVAFDKLDYTFKGTPSHGDFKTFVRHLLQKMTVHYGSEHVATDTIISQLARELALDWNCRMGDKNCVDNAHKKLLAGNIPGPLQITNYCNGIKNANFTVFDQLFSKMKSSQFQTERLRILDGLLCSNDKESLNFLLGDISNSNVFFRIHERRRAFNTIATRSEIGLETLIHFIQLNHANIRAVMGNDFLDGLLVTISTRVLNFEDSILLTEIIEFFRQEPSHNLSDKTIEDIEKNIAKNNEWRSKDHFSALKIYLKNYANNIWRLPKSSVPVNYEIHLDLRNVQNGDLAYSGDVKIEAEIFQDTDLIVIHSKNQQFQKFSIFNINTNREVPVLYFNLYPETDQVTIFLDQLLSVGTRFTINVAYTTQLLTEIDGLYQDSYIATDGSKRYLATTQFQAVEARRVFPSYDEPALKATFDVSITHSNSYSAVANMPIIREIINGEFTTTYFETTPVMSSYLNAFLVSDFEQLTNEATRLENEALQGIWTRPGEKEKAQYGLNNSVIILNELEKFVNVKFNLPKLDSGAIPGKGGGMENWGLGLYREGALIYEDDISHSLMQRGVRLIAHEVVHMFFGNLVTGEWWNYLWLNEGFATDLMYSILELIYPDWHMKEFFSRNIMISYAFTTDAAEDVRSMSSELITTDDINDSFDDIAYDKAACVLRMMGYAVGIDTWSNALHHYLQTNKFKPTNSQHLIEAVYASLNASEISFPDFERAFKSWENQGGYPLVTAHYDQRRSSLILTQKRFIEKNPNHAFTNTYYIPINYATEIDHDFENTTITHFMKDGEYEIIIPLAGFDATKWFLLNKQQVGYYRVNYDAANWKALIDFLHSDKFEEIAVVNRMHLLDNAFVLAHEGYIDYKIPYDLATYLIEDKIFFTWDIFMDNINRLYEIFGSRNIILNRFIYHMSKKFYSQYKLQGSTINPEIMPVRYGRELAYFMTCNAGNEDCLADVKTLAKLDVTGVQRIPRGLEDPVLCNYFKQETIEEEWMEVFDRMNKLQQNADYTLKTNFINALACTNDANILYSFLYSTIDPLYSNYTRDDRRNVFNAVLRNELGVITASNFMEANARYNTPQDFFGWSLQRILTNIGDAVYTAEEREKYVEFLRSFTHDDLTITIRNRVEYDTYDNFRAQDKAENVVQMNHILFILENIFDENITTTPRPTTSTTDSPPPETTTKNSAQFTAVNTILMTTFTVLIFKLNLF